LTLTTTSTADIVFDGDVNVDSIVDLEIDPRSAILDEDSACGTVGSRCKVKDGVDVERRRQGRDVWSTPRSTSTSSEHVPGL
jgi:hypothetical protein